MGWSRGIVSWKVGKLAHVSVPFTWLLPKARELCESLDAEGLAVTAGGPAVKLMPDMLGSYVSSSEVGISALNRHNPDAVFTSRGCIRKCKFCAVPRIEGDLIELGSWEPKPIICDNNLLACSRAHFDRVIDSLKPLKGIDFNQGLDARLLTAYHASRLAELRCKVIRLAWDHIEMEAQFMAAVHLLREAGFPKSRINAYVLIGFHDTPEDAMYRCQTVKGLGMWPNPQRYQPLDALKKNNYVPSNWDEEYLRKFVRYWSKQVWLKNVPFEEYDHYYRRKK